MNKKGKNPTLTTILIGTLIALTVVTLSFTAYQQFMDDNSGIIDPHYIGYYGNLTEQGDELTDLGYDISDQDNILGDIFEGALTTINLFVIGLRAIGSFFQMIPILSQIISITEEAIPGFSEILGLLALIITIYIAMRYIQSARSSVEAP